MVDGLELGRRRVRATLLEISCRAPCGLASVDESLDVASKQLHLASGAFSRIRGTMTAKIGIFG